MLAQPCYSTYIRDATYSEGTQNPQGSSETEESGGREAQFALSGVCAIGSDYGTLSSASNAAELREKCRWPLGVVGTFRYGQTTLGIAPREYLLIVTPQDPAPLDTTRSRQMFREADVPIVGQIAFHIALGRGANAGTPVVIAATDSPQAAFTAIAADAALSRHRPATADRRLPIQ